MPRRRSKPAATSTTRKTPANNRYRAEDILALFDNQQALSWRDLVGLAQADTPRSITQLRQMLKGLERNQQIQRDHQGNYYLAGSGSEVQGVLVRRGRELALDGHIIAAAGAANLRAGDRVAGVLNNGHMQVLKVVEHSPEPVIGVLNWQGRYAAVEGIGAFRGKIRLLEQPVDLDHGDTVAVKIMDRDRRGLLGVVVDVLPSQGVLDQAIQTAIAGGEIPHVWPEAVERAVTRLPKRVYVRHYPHRVDLTAMPLVTIDGESAKDFDDAVYAEKVGRQWRVVVAIADVAHYVKSGSSLDKEALLRGTSVYFPQRVIPMLPEAISNELCSLKPDTPRLAVVCDMRVNNKGLVAQHQFYEAVIHSRARLTYTQVQAFVDQQRDAGPLPIVEGYESPVLASLTALQQAYAKLREARQQRGALDFDTQEAHLQLDANGAVTAIEPVVRQQAHQMIEEMMIAANVCAAQFLEAHEQPSLYRVHEPPDADKLEELRQALAVVGVRLSPGVLEPRVLQQAMLRLPADNNPWIYAQLALRSLQQAVYTPQNQGHFGLALERYMHFTSPIRRYPDLLVHRAIKAVLAGQTAARRKPQKLPTVDQLHSLGDQCSQHERRAESAGWVVDGWLKCHYLQRELGNVLDGIVAGVTEFGLFVEIEGYFIQGLLHVSSLGSDYFNYHPRSLALVGERSGQHYRLGDQLRVRIVDIEPAQGRINLELPNDSGAKRRGRRSRTRSST